MISIAKYIQRELLPAQDEQDSDNSKAAPLPIPAVEAAIKRVATRVNYGVGAPNGGKIPPGLCVWRWEVKSEYYDWLPKVSREKIDARLVERQQVRIRTRGKLCKVDIQQFIRQGRTSKHYLQLSHRLNRRLCLVPKRRLNRSL